MTGRTARLWSVRIPRLVWEAVVGGSGEVVEAIGPCPHCGANTGRWPPPPLMEYVHARVNAAMRARGYRWLRGRWIHVDDLKAAIGEDVHGP